MRGAKESKRDLINEVIRVLASVGIGHKELYILRKFAKEPAQKVIYSRLINHIFSEGIKRESERES